MKYPWAKVGVKVVCVNKANWTSTQTGEPSCGPQEGEILVIWDIDRSDDGDVCLSFQKWNYALGHPCSWDIKNFCPLTEDRSRTQSQVDKLKRLTAQPPISVKGVDA